MGDDSLKSPEKQTFDFLTKMSVARKWSSDFYNKTLKSSENVFKQIGETVNVKEILSEIVHEFNSNQKQFEQHQVDQATMQHQQQPASSEFLPICTSDAGITLPPWHPDLTGITDSAVTNSLRDRVLSLTAQPNNFLIPPAELTDSGARFIMPDNLVAMVQLLMKLDPKLDQIRYELVPKKISEDLFWRNYLARISFIQQTVKLSALVNPNDASTTPTTASNTHRLNPTTTTINTATSVAASTPVSDGPNRDRAGSQGNINSTKAESSSSTTSTLNTNSPDTDFICINSAEHQERQQQDDDEDTFYDKELAKEVDELVLNASIRPSDQHGILDQNNGDDDDDVDVDNDDELDAELEMEIMAEIDQLRSEKNG